MWIGNLIIYIQIKNSVFSSEFLGDYTESAGSFLSDIVSNKLITNKKTKEFIYCIIPLYSLRVVHNCFSCFILDE